jgi:hypothetical protein
MSMKLLSAGSETQHALAKAFISSCCALHYSCYWLGLLLLVAGTTFARDDDDDVTPGAT